MLTLERRQEIRKRAVEPFLDLSDVYATYETNQTTASYIGDRKSLGTYQRPGGSAELRRLATIRRMDKARDTDRRRNQAEAVKRREAARADVVADYLALMPRRKIRQKYGLTTNVIGRMIREGVAPEEIKRIERHHGTRRQKRHVSRRREMAA